MNNELGKLKFVLICRDDRGTNRVFVLKNVSSVIASNIYAESFELIYHDKYRKDLLTDDIVLPTSLGPNEEKEFLCSHPALKNRGVGYNKICLLFFAEDEQSNKYKCVATKNVEQGRGFLLGIWDLEVEFIDNGESKNKDSNSSNLPIDLQTEFVSACAKIADNPVSYFSFDEDGLNREVRNFMDSAITRFGYTIADQTQQGLSGTNPGELDIRISKNGIPVAIFEGLIHKDRDWLYKHISKAIGKYNQSGCKAVYVVEYSRNKGFGGFWDSASEALDKYSGIDVEEENTGLLGVRMLKGTFKWEGQKGDFYYIGVNCYTNN